ncbi:MAG: SDR family oxidoreductase [Gammaproteobacteria bacterium]|nr:SDR family oxidoreductase [Gammaproteobacteria bacterium]
MTTPIGIEAGLRVLVTAGASGIGLAIAETLSAAGAKVHICDISEPALEQCANEHSDWGVSLCDVSDENQVNQLFADVEQRFFGLDVLVNNAGIAGPTGNIEELSSADWVETINVNLNGQFYCARLAVPLLKQSKNASLICLSSAAGRLGYAYRTPYAASKWAIVGLVKSLAIELGPQGVRVNALLPGIVAGPRIEKVIAARAEVQNLSYDEMEAQYLQQVSLRKMVTAQDIANQALFLCSYQGSSISGQAISICGNVEYL